MLKEFKEFAMKGNIMDMAVGVVIGGAFQKIVTSLVNDIIMPLVSVISGKVDFSDKMFTVGDASVKYGNFITAIVDFLIVAFSIFLVVKYANKLNKIKELGDFATNAAGKIDKKGRLKKFKKGKEEIVPEAPVEPENKICPFCLTEIKYKAVRCPHCTSELIDYSKKEEEVEA